MILADFIIGLPGETKETIEKAIRFVKELKPDLMQFSIACPIPGTEFYEWVKENGFLVTNDLDNFLDERGLQKSVVSYPELTNKDMEQFVDKTLREYYLSISYMPIAIKCFLRKNGFPELKRMIRCAKRFIKYVNGEIT